MLAQARPISEPERASATDPEIVCTPAAAPLRWPDHPGLPLLETGTLHLEDRLSYKPTSERVEVALARTAASGRVSPRDLTTRRESSAPPAESSLVGAAFRLREI